MYAVRGAQAHADALWDGLRDAIRSGGIDARSGSLISHTARGMVAPRFDIGARPAGCLISQSSATASNWWARPTMASRLPTWILPQHARCIVRRPRTHLSEFSGCALAINGKDSQSGYGAIMLASAPYAREGRFFDRAIHTGSHEGVDAIGGKGVGGHRGDRFRNLANEPAISIPTPPV